MRSIFNTLFAVALITGASFGSAKAENDEPADLSQLGATLLEYVDSVNGPSWKNIYLMGALGYASFNLEESDVRSSSTGTLQPSADDNDFAYRVGLGYRLNDVFALEFAYTDLGSPVEVSLRDTPGPTVGAPAVDTDYSEIAEISALARFEVPELSNLAPFLRVGGFAYDGDYHDGFWVHYGAGIEWYNVRLEYIRYEFEPEAVDTFFVGIALPLSLFAR